VTILFSNRYYNTFFEESDRRIDPERRAKVHPADVPSGLELHVLVVCGLPFVIVVALLIPLAYCPSYRIPGADPGFFAFWRQWISLDYWPSGPFWFLSLLLSFDFIVVIVQKFVSGWGDALGKKFSRSFRRPVLFFCCRRPYQP
jgi:hypothetical protein